MNLKYIGVSVQRDDSRDKARGRYSYLGDKKIDGLLEGVIVTSTVAHGIIKNIHKDSALAIPGVRAVFTCLDVPKVFYNSGEWFDGQNDHIDELLLTDRARHIGDRVALVVAESIESARVAAALVRVEYESLPPILDLIEAASEEESSLFPGEPARFEGAFSYGNIVNAFDLASSIVETTVETPRIHHAAIETHMAICIPRPGGIFEVQTPCQIIFGVQHIICRVLGLPYNKVRVIKSAMGGTFGGKQETTVEPLCVFASQKLESPVRVTLNRTESILSTRTRAAMKGTMKTAFDDTGKILGRDVSVIVDAGAYLTGSKKVMMAMAKKTSRLYRIPAINFNGVAVRTNRTPGGACRGYGSPQIGALTEIHMDIAAKRLGVDPIALRLRNLVHPWDKDPSGGPYLGNSRVIDCLIKGVARFNWTKRYEPTSDGRFRRAAGFACATHGNGYVGAIYHDFASMTMRLLEDGTAIVNAGLYELGNGTVCAIKQIIAETLNLSPERILATEGDTQYSLYDIGCQASRAIYVCGGCALKLAGLIREKLLAQAADYFRIEIQNLSLDEGYIHTSDGRIATFGEIVRHTERVNNMEIAALAEYRPTGNPASFGVHFAEVEIDSLTGLVRVLDYLAVHDVGQVINPQLIKGQIYGGVQMGIGMALTEEITWNSFGQPSCDNFNKYHLINSADMPDVDVLLIEEGEPGAPFGAKSIGEIATVPPAPAIVNAVNRALGMELTVLPLTGARIIEALHGNRKK